MRIQHKLAGALLAAFFSTASTGAVFTVSNTNDIATGSLREAMTFASNCAGAPHTIQFAIAGAGPHTIQPFSPLPTVVCDVAIDGFSQPGSVLNTNATGNNADIRIILNGSSCSGCNGLTLSAANAKVRAISIHSFPGAGIDVLADGAIIHGNYIGTDPGGMTAFPNQGGGITGASNGLQIGSGADADTNLITANFGNQVEVIGSGVQVLYNQIGGDRAGGNTLGGPGAGIYISDPVGSFTITGNRILRNQAFGVHLDNGGASLSANVISDNFPAGVLLGSTGALFDGNLVGFNSGPGIRVEGSGFHTVTNNYAHDHANDGIRISSSDNLVAGNSVYQNSGAGIRVLTGTRNELSGTIAYLNSSAGIVLGSGAGGVPNDETAPPYDQDSGPNELTNHPVITSAVNSAGSTIVSGTLKSTAGAMAFIDVFANPSPPATASTQTFLGATGVVLDANGYGTWSLTAGGTYSYVTAIASVDPCGGTCKSTSEISPAVVATAGGSGGVLAAAPSSLAFSDQAVGSTSPTQSVSLTNTGTNQVNIVTIVSSGDFQFTTTCGITLLVGQTCQFDVGFRPLQAGLRSGGITITSDATVNPFVIPLQGNGTAAPRAGIAVEPTEHNFGAVRVGDASDRRAVRVSNTGSARLDFSFGTTNEEFRIVRSSLPMAKTLPVGTYTTCTGSLNVGQFCEIVLEFAPQRTGARAGLLVIDSNAANAAPNVRLSGFGTGDFPARLLSVPSGMDLGDQVLGRDSAGAILVITNTSRDRVRLIEVSASAGDFRIGEGCTEIEPGATCERRVFFKPSELGSRTGRIVIRTDTEPDPYVVELAGRGVANPVPQLGLSVGAIGFGNVLGTSTVAVRLTNEGQLPVSLRLIAALGDFMAVSRCGPVIDVRGECIVDVTFFPRLTGFRLGELLIESDAAGSPHRVELSATGCRAPSAAFNRTRTMLCGPGN